MLINYKSFDLNANRIDFSVSFASLLMINNDVTTVNGYVGGQLVFSIPANSALELKNILPPIDRVSSLRQRNILTIECSGINTNFQIYNYGSGY